MPRITAIKGGFNIQHTTREVWGVDDDDANGYDYRHQAYVVDGRYVACGHGKPCDCYGTIHAGQLAAPDADIH